MKMKNSKGMAMGGARATAGVFVAVGVVLAVEIGACGGGVQTEKTGADGGKSSSSSSGSGASSSRSGTSSSGTFSYVPPTSSTSSSVPTSGRGSTPTMASSSSTESCHTSSASGVSSSMSASSSGWTVSTTTVVTGITTSTSSSTTTASVTSSANVDSGIPADAALIDAADDGRPVGCDPSSGNACILCTNGRWDCAGRFYSPCTTDAGPASACTGDEACVRCQTTTGEGLQLTCRNHAYVALTFACEL